MVCMFRLMQLHTKNKGDILVHSIYFKEGYFTLKTEVMIELFC